MKFKEMSETEQTYSIENNKTAFVDYYGVPEEGKYKHYISKKFLFDFFERNNIEFDKELNVVMK